MLTGSVKINQAIESAGNLDIIPASDKLALSKDIDGTLQNALRQIANKYDFVIIDTPPTLSALTLNALRASDYALIPAIADIFSLQAIEQLAETIEAVSAVNKRLRVLGILLTRHNPRSILAQQFAGLIARQADKLKSRLFDHVIREGVAIRESQTTRRSIFDYAPKSKQAKDYGAVIDEILEIIATA